MLHTLLQKYQLTPDDYLGRGMEAQVYRYGPDEVLKIYRQPCDMAYMQRLEHFYRAIDRRGLPFALPEILEVSADLGYVVVRERRLHGTNLQTLLPTLTPAQLATVMHRYCDTAMAVAHIVRVDESSCGLLLRNPTWQHGINDWHTWWWARVQAVLAHSGVLPFLQRDVPHLAPLLAYLQAYLAQPYQGTYALVHGDLYPGNLLVDDQLQIQTVLDFGQQSMWGDPHYDIATSWVWFDMYDELECDTKGQYLAVLQQRFGTEMMERWRVYVLLYSIISANQYDATCQDGHYQWCVHNLNGWVLGVALVIHN